MSSLWTPGGERPVPPPEGSRSQSGGATGSGGPTPPTDQVPPNEQLTEEELAQRMAELRQRLADTPVEDVVANHCYGLFELGALHLSLDPPQLDAARAAIDALTCLVEGMEGRLGKDEGSLKEGLAQLRLAFVQISGSSAAGDGSPKDQAEKP